MRKLGDIMLDMEQLLLELHGDHDLQHGEVLYLVNGWQQIHMPNQAEIYNEDGTNPVLHPIYGHRELFSMPAEYGTYLIKELTRDNKPKKKKRG